MIDLLMYKSSSANVLAAHISDNNSRADVRELILALDEEMADLDFTKELYECLGVAIALEEEEN